MSTAETSPRSIKQRIKDGDKISHSKIPTNASREQVHEFIAERAPDMIYLDAHHSPITEWDISRICRAGQEKDTPMMMRIKHVNPASLISSLLDIGVFSIKAPTVEDEATVDAIIDAFYYPPVGKRSLGGSNNYGEGAKKLGPDGNPYFEWWNNNAVLGIKLEILKGVPMLVTWPNRASTMLILAHRTWVTILQSSSTLVSQQSLLARTS